MNNFFIQSRLSLKHILSMGMLAACISVIGAEQNELEKKSDQPKVPQDPVLSPFGIGSCALRSRDQAPWMPQMAKIGLRDLRNFGTWWGGLEPTQGTFVWDSVDKKLDYLESIGVTPGALLVGLPKWDKKDRRGGLPMKMLPEWSNYVFELAKHTKGRVKHFEVWNEPPNGTNKAPASDYAKVVIAAYEGAKKGNPDAQVGIAVKSAHINYLYQAIRAGAKGHYDYVTMHPYEILGCVTKFPGTESVYMSIIPTLRKMLADQDPDKVNVPVWFTELGCNAGKQGPAQQAQAVVKAYTMGIAQGLACLNWFEGMDGDSGPMGLIDRKGTPRPAYHALARLIENLGRHPGYYGWVLLNDKHYGFLFKGAKGNVMVTWAATPNPEEVNFGQEVQIIDPPSGKETKAVKWKLSMDPIIIPGIPEKFVAQAKSNKNKPFPWDGDYSNANSVSVNFGKTNIEKGLHTKSAKSIADDIVAYGGNARAGTVPGGNVFMVDPNFLSYTTVPIEITAVVRLNEKNQKEKLVLEYESTSGYKKPEPYVIPDNKEWHTATWKIDDAQFVGTWAFNFRFNKGKYCIQKVTVTKLDK